MKKSPRSKLLVTVIQKQKRRGPANREILILPKVQIKTKSFINEKRVNWNESKYDVRCW